MCPIQLAREPIRPFVVSRSSRSAWPLRRTPSAAHVFSAPRIAPPCGDSERTARVIFADCDRVSTLNRRHHRHARPRPVPRSSWIAKRSRPRAAPTSLALHGTLRA